MTTAQIITTPAHILDTVERLTTSWHQEVKRVKVRPYNSSADFSLGRIAGICYSLALLLGVSVTEMNKHLTGTHDAWCEGQIR